MKKLIGIAIVLVIFTSCNQKEMKNNQDAVTAVIKNYELGLSSGDVNLILDTYDDSAMFLLYNHEPMKGKEALSEFYTGFFKNVSTKMEMKISSIEISEDLAYVISVSSGTVKFLANGTEIEGAGQELFVLKRRKDADWKIIAYHASSRTENN